MAEATQKRVCEFRYCDDDISHMRPNAKFCCPAHRAAEDRMRHGRWVREAGGSGDGTGKAHSTVVRHRRRPNRDGSGTRIYLTPRDIAQLRRGTVTADVKAKAARAAARIQGGG